MAFSATDQFLGNATFLNFDQQALAFNSVASIFGITGLTEISMIFYSSTFFTHSPHQMLILSLCAADFILCLVSTIAVCVNLVRGGWLAGQAGLTLCMITNWVNVTTVFISIISYNFIALERYLVIFRNLSGHENKTKIGIAIFWIFAGGLGAIASNTGEKAILLPSMISCGPRSSRALAFYAIYPLFAVSPVVMVYCYYSIFKFYRNTQFESRRANEDETRVKSPKEKLLFYKLLAITGTFLFFFMPFVGIKIGELTTLSTTSPLLDSIRAIFLLCNSIVNPIILYIFDPQIRYQLNAIFHIDRIIKNTSKLSIKSQALSKNLSSAAKDKSNTPDRDTVKISL